MKDYREEKKHPVTQADIEEMVLGEQPFAEQSDIRNCVCPVMARLKKEDISGNECLNSEYYPNEQTYLCRLANGNELSNIPQICGDYKGMFYVNRQQFYKGRINDVLAQILKENKEMEKAKEEVPKKETEEGEFKPYANYERLDLTKCMIHKDNPNGPKGNWSAGDQLEAMSYYTDGQFRLILTMGEMNYQGEIWGIAHYSQDSYPRENRVVLFRDSFGSCSGCDGLEDKDGYSYIHTVLMENTVQFETFKQLWMYLNTEAGSNFIGNIAIERFKLLIQDYIKRQKIIEDYASRNAHPAPECTYDVREYHDAFLWNFTYNDMKDCL